MLFLHLCREKRLNARCVQGVSIPRSCTGGEVGCQAWQNQNQARIVFYGTKAFCVLSFPAAVGQPCYADRGGRLVAVTFQGLSAVQRLLFHCC